MSKEAKDPVPRDISSVPSEKPTKTVVLASEAEEIVSGDKIPVEVVSTELKMSREAKDHVPRDISSVPSQVPTEPVVVGSEREEIISGDKLPVEGVDSGDNREPVQDVVPSPDEVPKNASVPDSSSESPSVLSAVEGGNGVKKKLSDEEVSKLVMEFEDVHSKIASFGTPGQFLSVDDILNELRLLSEKVAEGEHRNDQIIESLEGKLKESQTENDALKLKVATLQETCLEQKLDIDSSKLHMKASHRQKEEALLEVSKINRQLEEMDKARFESQQTVWGLVDILDSKDKLEAIYRGLYQTAGEAMFKAMAMAGDFVRPSTSVVKDLKKIMTPAEVRMPLANLHEMCGEDFDLENVRKPEEPKQGCSKARSLVESKRAESVGSGSTTEPTKFSRTHAPRKGPKSKKRSGRPKSRIVVVSSGESSESDREVPESPDDFQRKEPKKGGAGVKGAGRRRARSTSSTKSTDALEDAVKKLKKGKGSEVPPKKKIKVEEAVDADVDNPVDADVDNPVNADVENPVNADVENRVDADVENPVEAGSMFTKDGLYDKRQIALELQSRQFLCGVCYRTYTAKHTWLRHACKHDLHFIQFKEVTKYGQDLEGKPVSQSVKKGFCKYCNTEADVFPPEQKYYEFYNKDTLKFGLNSWIADEKARGDLSYVKKLKKTK